MHEAINKAKTLIPNQKTPIQVSKGSSQTPLKLTTVSQSEISNQKSQITQAQRIEALTTAFTYFVRNIHQGRDQASHDYLKSRVLNSGQLHVGYDSRKFHQGASKEMKALYHAIGLLTPYKQEGKEYYASFFSDCIVFPTFNEKNEIVNLYGRCTDESKENKHRYLKGKHQGIYPCYPKPETEVLIITESIIDAATLLQLKVESSKSKVALTEYELLACYGTNNFTEEHQNAIKNLKRLKEVIFFFDGDKAGREAVLAHTTTLQKQMPLVKIYYIETPQGEDINSLAQAYEEKAGELFTEFLSNRKFSLSTEKGILLKITDERKPINESKVEATREQQSFQTSSPEISIRNTQDSRLNTDNPEQLIYETEWLTATVWGGIDIYNLKKLKVTLHIQNKENEYLEYRDTLDLYSHHYNQKLIRTGGEILEISTHKMIKTVTGLTRSLENYRQKERDKERKREESEKRKNQETFTREEMQQGEQLLKSKELMQKTELHISNIGLVGEEEKGLLLFFILLTRMFNDPLHALVQGKSGSGKTYLLKKIASLIPKAHIRITTALTENTLYHSLKDFWKHMILLIEDLDGAMNALLPLREMMSNQSISKLSTEKNLKTGEFEQKILYVEGPICVAGATTKDRIYEDNANRSFLIQVNETSEHQERVLEYQRKEIAGLMDKSKEKEAQTLLKTAQLHLEPLEVTIPFGEELRIPDYVFKKLRTNAHYLTLIKAIAFWNQKQREIKQKADGTRYIEASLQDVEWANKLSKEVLLRKSDELNGALRGFFESIKSWMKANNIECFYAKPLREKLRMNPMQINRYLKELDQRGYIKQTGGNRKTGFEYTITVWDDYEQLKAGMNILDDVLEKLKKKYEKK